MRKKEYLWGEIIPATFVNTKLPSDQPKKSEYAQVVERTPLLSRFEELTGRSHADGSSGGAVFLEFNANSADLDPNSK